MKKLTLNTLLKRKLDRLEKIDKPIYKLYYRGASINEFAHLPTVAIVGTRKPTMYGRSQTEGLARILAKSGVVVVSGLALGVDAIAHQTAYDEGGKCIAVLPSDVDNIYPATNRTLGEAFANSNHCALVSEYKSNRHPRREDFLIRNRIVAALSDSVIVTEAAARSGTLNTAQHARNMGIKVFAVPGPVTAPTSAGCNWLIQQGAQLLSSPEQILKELGVDKRQQKLDLSSVAPEHAELLEKISQGVTLTDELLQESKIGLDDLQLLLTELEIDGRIAQNSQGEWSLL